MLSHLAPVVQLVEFRLDQGGLFQAFSVNGIPSCSVQVREHQLVPQDRREAELGLIVRFRDKVDTSVHIPYDPEGTYARVRKAVGG